MTRWQVRIMFVCYLFLLLVYRSLPACKAVHHALAVPLAARRGHHMPPALELQTVVSCHMGIEQRQACNGIEIICLPSAESFCTETGGGKALSQCLFCSGYSAIEESALTRRFTNLRTRQACAVHICCRPSISSWGPGPSLHAEQLNQTGDSKFGHLGRREIYTAKSVLGLLLKYTSVVLFK